MDGHDRGDGEEQHGALAPVAGVGLLAAALEVYTAGEQDDRPDELDHPPGRHGVVRPIAATWSSRSA